MGNVEIPNWLKGLPMAPVFRPTDTEFADPIAYISKIEKEASAFGICKIIPPLPKPSKKYVFGNLNKSLSKCPDMGPGMSLRGLGSLSKMGSGDGGKDGEARAVFTTRQQELGLSVKKTKGAANNPPHSSSHKQVWQSGEIYTLEQFEAKSKAFARTLLSMTKDLSPLVVEALFWKAAKEKPIYVEYANDVPGSGFGEPEEQSQYLRRRRRTRTRTSYHRQSEKEEAGDANESCSLDPCENKAACTETGTTVPPDTCDQSQVPPKTSDIDHTSAVYRKGNLSNASINFEVEGSAGWKLSNSPWNLQVIARSPGSLTRFMPDDIPGVTSPMIYIGMLFSWFAWHVEDHELHSMNYLHMGSPKTWYSVPGDYAFKFEEIIRADAYGGNIDQIAALSLLGEKTTLVSPEVMVASGIPCCRLVQNPGEFVVTFPRAYHVGFSHGFNCGEAANFATPQWLRFAREAAVRRAVMNYLPMLSHQQLLYLLTMSFVSRVPRSLLPGSRTSRLRDRQREERELSVKKAFVEDIMNENHLLSSLLEKDSSHLAVVWNPNSLLSLSRESELPDGSALLSTHLNENNTSGSSNNSSSRDLSLYLEAQSELDMENDDLLFDFQVDSGTLACVACGVLGFPFMCVLQPSGSDSLELPSVDDIPSVPPPDSSRAEPRVAAPANLRKGWDTSSRFRRPRIFCLKHAVQVLKILQSKGGGNLLVICHSDYQKMKAYAAVIAEETSTSFDYKEIPLDSATQEDLSLIELAVVDDGNGHEDQDWTSILGINLRHCVRVRKNYPSERAQHGLTLSTLLSSESIPNLNVLGVKWRSRKSRTRTRTNHPPKFEPYMSLQSSGAVLQKNTDIDGVKQLKNIIQYTRRNPKSKPRESGRTCSNTDDDSSSASLPISTDVVEHEVPVLEASGSLGSGFLPAQVVKSPANTSQFVGSVEVEIICQSLDGMEVDEEARSTSLMQDQEEEEDRSNSHKTNCSSPSEAEIGDSHRRDDNLVNEISEAVHSRSEGHRSETQAASLEEDRGPDDSVEECRDAPSRVYSEKEELRHSSPTGSGLPLGIEEISVDAVSEEEYNESSDGTRNGHLSESACSDDEPGGEDCTASDLSDDKINKCEVRSSQEPETRAVEVPSSQGHAELGTADRQVSRTEKKRKRSEVEMIADDKSLAIGFVKSPCEGLRSRGRSGSRTIGSEGGEKPVKKMKQHRYEKSGRRDTKEDTTSSSRAYRCNLEGCRMSFKTREELSMHRRNRCHHKGCGKKFSSHKYAVLHQRVHEDDRPLKCPWKGCGMSFKWAWARTEHIRVHTGERPYKCKVEGCGLSFRFISDYNRHRRKTGHYAS